MAEDGIESFPFEVSQLLRAEPEAPSKWRSRELLENLVYVLRGRCPPSKQGDRRRADYNFILREIPLQPKSVIPPPFRVQRFPHDFEHDNLVVDVLPPPVVVPVVVGAANGAGRDLDDRIAGILDLRIGNRIDPNVAFSVPA
jgi:hypothetical protein